MKKSRSIVLALILLIPIFTITITTRATAIPQLPSNINNNKNEPASSFLEYLPLNQGNRMLSYAMVALRPTNIISLAIQSPSSSSPSAARPPSPLTKALRSIMGNVVEEKDNNNNLTKAMITTTTSSSKLNTNNTYYFRSNSKNNSSSPFKNKINPQDFGKGLDIALIKPTFTAAAYHNSFYIFYKLYGSVPEGKNITTHLDLLSSKITSKISKSSPSILPMLHLLTNLKSAIPKSNIAVLTDADVDNGSIFIKNNNNSNYNSNIGKNNNNNNVYDIIILGHQEYVTQQEYNNLKKFVTNGGIMILLDGNVFYAEVKYDRDNQNITLVKGHGWAFNGRSAWKSVAERWKEETSQWVGSNYFCYDCGITFDNDPFEYKQHEEQYITNPKDVILFNYEASAPTSSHNEPSLVPLSSSHLLLGSRGGATDTKRIVATYELNY